MNRPFFSVIVGRHTPKDKLETIKELSRVMGHLDWGISIADTNKGAEEVYFDFLNCPNVNPNTQVRFYVDNKVRSTPIKIQPGMIDIENLQITEEQLDEINKDNKEKYYLSGYESIFYSLLGDHLKNPVRQILSYCDDDWMGMITAYDLAHKFNLPVLDIYIKEHLERAKELISSSNNRLADKLWFG